MGEVTQFPRTQGLIVRGTTSAVVSAPVTIEEETCPTCKMPLADTAHGWVKLYEEHAHNEQCLRRYGFCLIPCPMCTGGVAAKRAAQLVNDLFKDANIPFYAKEWTFASYPQNADAHAKREVQSQLSFWLSGAQTKRALYLVGKNGQCKTGLAIAALHAWLRKGHSGVFITTIGLFDVLKGAIAASKRDADYQDRYDASQAAKLHRLVKSVELLILDDLGVECGSPYEIRELYLVLEARRSQGLYTIFTSNRDAKDLEQYWRSEKGVFQDALRVIDRIGEYAFIVPTAGRNQREQR